MSKIRVDNIVDRNDSAGPNFTYGASIPEGQYFNHQGNINNAGIATVGILSVTDGVIGNCTASDGFVGDGSDILGVPKVGPGATYALGIILDPLPFRS